MILLTLIILICCNLGSSSKILCVYPHPALSHQQVFRVFTEALLKRGHEVTVITPYPAYKKENRPQNLTEVDTSHIVAHAQKGAQHVSKKREEWFYVSTLTGPNFRWLPNQTFATFKFNKEAEPYTKGFNGPFDLIIVEDLYDYGMILSEVFKAPMITFSSFCGMFDSYEAIGAPASHYLLYPTIYRLRLDNLSFIEKLCECYIESSIRAVFEYIDTIISGLLKMNLGEKTKDLRELRDNMDALIVNMHPLFEGNRPVPINVIQTNALHMVGRPQQVLPETLKQFLDKSTRGVIYVSFGSYFSPANMYPSDLEILLTGFEMLPYEIVWRFDGELPWKIPNVYTNKWFPQVELLKHPNIKAFITQGGLQSTDEAIDAGVPLVCIPMFADQWYNAENYIRLGIGVKLDFMALTVEDLVTGVKAVAGNDSYRENIVRLRTLMNDQPETPVERAVWWTEYVIRHKGAQHLRSSAANVPLEEYLHIDLFIVIGTIFLSLISGVVFLVYKIVVLLSNVRLIVKNVDSIC